MRMKSEYDWAQEKLEEVTRLTKEQREGAACQRRLKQMAAKKEKQAKRLAATEKESK